MKDHITIKSKVNFYLNNYPESIDPESVVHVNTREVVIRWQLVVTNAIGELSLTPTIIEQPKLKVQIEVEDKIEYEVIYIDLNELELQEVEYQEHDLLDKISFLIRPIEITVDLKEKCYYLVMG